MGLEKIKILMKQKGYTSELLSQKCGVPGLINKLYKKIFNF